MLAALLERESKAVAVRSTPTKIRQAALAPFCSAQRFFIISDKRFRAAGLMGLRFGADFPCHAAQRFFIASDMRWRAAGLILRRFPPAVDADSPVLGGRPRRCEEDEVSPSSAEIA